MTLVVRPQSATSKVLNWLGKLGGKKGKPKAKDKSGGKE